MADYNVICASCSHGPHTLKPCMVSKCECKVFVRIDTALVRLLDMLVSVSGQISDQLTFLTTMLANVHKEEAELAYKMLSGPRTPPPEAEEEQSTEENEQSNTDNSAPDNVRPFDPVRAV